MLTAVGEERTADALLRVEGPLTVGIADGAGELRVPGYSRKPLGNGSPVFGPAIRQSWDVRELLLFSKDRALLATEPLGPIRVQPGQYLRTQVKLPGRNE